MCFLIVEVFLGLISLRSLRLSLLLSFVRSLLLLSLFSDVCVSSCMCFFRYDFLNLLISLFLSFWFLGLFRYFCMVCWVVFIIVCVISLFMCYLGVSVFRSFVLSSVSSPGISLFISLVLHVCVSLCRPWFLPFFLCFVISFFLYFISSLFVSCSSFVVFMY